MDERRMRGKTAAKAASGLMVLTLGGGLSACNTLVPSALGSSPGGKSALLVSDEERDCLGRAMYFESNRSDEAGLLAVGTVVMNRTEATGFTRGICDVVGQPGQFARGVLTKPMETKDLQKIADVADAVLAGERHAQVGKAMYFHTAGRRYPYSNMHYVAVVGGNAFYEKRAPDALRQEAAAPVARRVPALAYVAAPSVTLFR